VHGSNVSERFSQLSARQRALALVDEGSFAPVGSSDAELPFVVGAGTAGGRPVLVALSDGHVRGGTLGVREAGVLARLAEIAARRARSGHTRAALIIGYDTGGVNVDEGPVALAAVSAVGVALARLTLLGVRAMSIISGPRGCFGAPAVMAALPERIVMTEDAHWGLTGPRLFGHAGAAPTSADEGSAVTGAEARRNNGDVHAVVADRVASVRQEVVAFAQATPPAPPPVAAAISTAAAVTARLRDRWQQAAGPRQSRVPSRRRDLLSYSFRGQWKATGPTRRAGLVHGALGTLTGRPALGLIVGPEEVQGGGLGIEESSLITEMIERASAAGAPPAPILTFLFCQGHAVDVGEERFGLPRALAQCLISVMAARMQGHPIVTVLGGGTYGAAYLALAAPSHRILAMRGTSVAPMAPKVYEAFQALRGRTDTLAADAQLAELIPEVRGVASVIGLPRILREELSRLLDEKRTAVA
jgi:malonate decarboxylase beta subunit